MCVYVCVLSGGGVRSEEFTASFDMCHRRHSLHHRLLRVTITKELGGCIPPTDCTGAIIWPVTPVDLGPVRIAHLFSSHLTSSDLISAELLALGIRCGLKFLTKKLITFHEIFEILKAQFLKFSLKFSAVAYKYIIIK